jgi:replicative DNA helicase
VLSDLRDSGAIEYISDIVLFIYRDGYYNYTDVENSDNTEVAQVIVAKNEFGPSGIANLMFDKSITKFSNREETELEF